MFEHCSQTLPVSAQSARLLTERDVWFDAHQSQIQSFVSELMQIPVTLHNYRIWECEQLKYLADSENRSVPKALASMYIANAKRVILWYNQLLCPLPAGVVIQDEAFHLLGYMVILQCNLHQPMLYVWNHK